MLFNLCGPHHSGLNAHLDAVTFRGIRIENSPVWLQNVMGKSGLFTDHLVKMAQVITWWYLRRERHVHVLARRPARRTRSGSSTRCGTRAWSCRTRRCSIAAIRSAGRDERDIPGLKHRSLIGYDADHDDWAITTDGEVIRRYRPEQMRLLVHWSAEVYADMDEVKKNMDHSDDLTHDVVFDRLLADMRSKGVECRRAVRSAARPRLHPRADRRPTRSHRPPTGSHQLRLDRGLRVHCHHERTSS